MNNEFNARVLPQLLDLGQPLLFYQSLPSSNSLLKELANKGQAHGTCVVADFQSQGRGRMNRVWQAQAGSSLLFSVLLRPETALANMFPCIALAALALCRALEEHGLEPRIKWPNDIYLQGLKLCGILSETGQNHFLVIGIGVNVNQEARDLTGLSAISLRMASNRQWERADLLAAILNYLSMYYQQWLQAPYAWHAPYIERSWLLGKRVMVRDGQRQLEGDALTVTLEGYLLLDTDQGQIRLNHGDVSILEIYGQDRCNCRPN